jgi:hypothetical protein
MLLSHLWVASGGDGCRHSNKEWLALGWVV